MCNFICQHDFSKPTISRLDEWLMQFDISKGGHATVQEIENHEFCTKGVTIQANHSKMQKLLLQIEAAAHQANQRARIPDDYALKTNLGLIVYTAHRTTWDRMLYLIDIHGLQTDTMSYEQFTSLIIQADHQPSARSTLIAKIRSLMTSSPSVPTETSAKHDHSARGAQQDQTPRPYPVYFKVNCQPQGPPKYYILEGLVGPGVTAPESARTKAHDAGGCSNCLNYKSKKYATHTASTCPYTTPNLLDRVFPHTPIPALNGRQPVESDPTTVQQFRDERKLLLSNAPPSTPPDPTRHPTVPTKQLFPIQQVEPHVDKNPSALPTHDDDDHTTPEEPPMKGPFKLTAWAASASPKNRYLGHMMIP
jgi:hypothetical protein